MAAMAGTAPDSSRAVSAARFVVYQQKGSAVRWDGNVFSGLDQCPVGIQFGLAVAQRLRQTH